MSITYYKQPVLKLDTTGTLNLARLYSYSMSMATPFFGVAFPISRGDIPIPTRPKPACPTCRQVNCTNPDHRYNWRTQRQRRPITDQEIKRRREAVQAYREQFGEVCPLCHQSTGPLNPLTADHIIPVADGGPEDGPLTILCRRCNSKKGGRGSSGTPDPRGKGGGSR